MIVRILLSLLAAVGTAILMWCIGMFVTAEYYPINHPEATLTRGYMVGYGFIVFIYTMFMYEGSDDD